MAAPAAPMLLPLVHELKSLVFYIWKAEFHIRLYLIIQLRNYCMMSGFHGYRPA